MMATEDKPSALPLPARGQLEPEERLRRAHPLDRQWRIGYEKRSEGNAPTPDLDAPAVRHNKGDIDGNYC